jgi:hypothetical protein
VSLKLKIKSIQHLKRPKELTQRLLLYLSSPLWFSKHL